MQRIPQGFVIPRLSPVPMPVPMPLPPPEVPVGLVVPAPEPGEGRGRGGLRLLAARTPTPAPVCSTIWIPVEIGLVRPAAVLLGIRVGRRVGVGRRRVGASSRVPGRGQRTALRGLQWLVLEPRDAVAVYAMALRLLLGLGVVLGGMARGPVRFARGRGLRMRRLVRRRRWRPPLVVPGPVVAASEPQPGAKVPLLLYWGAGCRAGDASVRQGGRCPGDKT